MPLNKYLPELHGALRQPNLLRVKLSQNQKSHIKSINMKYDSQIRKTYQR